MIFHNDMTTYAYTNMKELVKMHKSIQMYNTCSYASSYDCRRCCASSMAPGLRNRVTYNDHETCYTTIKELLTLLDPTSIFEELL